MTTPNDLKKMWDRDLNVSQDSRYVKWPDVDNLKSNAIGRAGYSLNNAQYELLSSMRVRKSETEAL